MYVYENNSPVLPFVTETVFCAALATIIEVVDDLHITTEHNQQSMF
jgi:hypothetical protein